MTYSLVETLARGASQADIQSPSRVRRETQRLCEENAEVANRHGSTLGVSQSRLCWCILYSLYPESRVEAIFYIEDKDKANFITPRLNQCAVPLVGRFPDRSFLSVYYPHCIWQRSAADSFVSSDGLTMIARIWCFGVLGCLVFWHGLRVQVWCRAGQPALDSPP